MNQNFFEIFHKYSMMDKITRQRKIPKGQIRDKERTKQNIIDAAGRIIKEKGFKGITYTSVAKEAGVDRKLLYEYFENLEELIAIYLKQHDYWDKIGADKPEESMAEISHAFMSNLLQNQFRYFETSPQMQNIVLYELMVYNNTLREIVDKREEWGEKIFKLSDKTFKGTNVNFRAISAILVSAIYYLILHNKTNGSKTCGINISKPAGKKAILKGIDQILGWAFKEHADK